MKQEFVVDMDTFRQLLDEKFGHLESKIDSFNAANEKDHSQYRADIDGLYEREMYNQKAINDRLDTIHDRLRPLDTFSVTMKSIEAENLRIKDSINQLFEENKEQEKDIAGLATALRQEIGQVDDSAQKALTTIQIWGAVGMFLLTAGMVVISVIAL